ncbi:SEC14 domain-containing protein [Cryptosporidium ubiquitum]|uniref:SEC14 domain-containing protein n=1 Tax=Cryptosporidium ubiquitum TaxID=857276 RepID=A0A1J4M9C7_9CRYT|nr:SEC14 domain-containing protein [Cryptosporidium ubiquitum]OII70818.1 SEC14 domain-containing protein [Cryptosporidium ubiquitum]
MHKNKSLNNHQEWDNKFAEEYKYAPLIITEKISEYTMPSEILLYDPTEDDIFTKFHVGSSNEFKIRQIFLHVELLKHEEEMLIEFDNFLTEKNIKLPEFINPLILRVLMFNKRRHPNTYIQRSMNHLISMFKWRVSMYPLSDMESDLRKDLESGIIYWHGRDYCLRPILTIRLSKVNKLFPLERFIRLIVFCMEWGMRYLMCPGKVETCLALIDIKGVSLTSFPISTMSEISSLLTNQYSFRLYRMFILHDSLFIQTVWSLMKQFLTDLQQHKIILSRNEIKSQLFKTVHPNQVEEHFGGLQKNIVAPFYPFVFPPGPFSDPKLHPKNGVTRIINQFNNIQMDSFNKVTNCHLLFNQFNVLGKLLYNNSSQNKIIWDEKGLEELKNSISSYLNINLENDKNPNSLNSTANSTNNRTHNNHYNLHNNNYLENNFSKKNIQNSNQKYNYGDIEQIEMTESSSYLEEDTNNMKLSTLSLPVKKTLSNHKEERNLSAEINIGIINTININTDITNIGDMSQHFIREYSVLSESPNLAENIAMIIEDSQSFFSASSSLYINDDNDNDNDQHIEDLHHSLLIDNPCYDHGIFQSFGVLPITMENFKHSGKKAKSSLKSLDSRKNNVIHQSSSDSLNLSNTCSSQVSSLIISDNSNEINCNTQIVENTKSNEEILNQTQDLKNLNDIPYNKCTLPQEDDSQIIVERSYLVLSPPIIDNNRHPVSSLNTSSCLSSMGNTKLSDSFSYVSKSNENPRISRKSRIKSKISKVINRIKTKSSIIEHF